jgi:hypothetical protein
MRGLIACLDLGCSNGLGLRSASQSRHPPDAPDEPDADQATPGLARHAVVWCVDCFGVYE